MLVTGGAGFIGSHFIRFMLERYDALRVVNLDALTYAGNFENLRDVEEGYPDRYTFVQGDIAELETVKGLLTAHQIDVVVNFAAESHNSRAVLDPGAFMRTNALGAQQLFEACRQAGVARVHHISTCEVFGDLEMDATTAFLETDPLRPRTPYNASKAAADLCARAYFETYQLPITVSVCANNYGPYQFPEKVIPLFTTNALEDQPLPLYRSSQHRREWLHVLDHCRAIALILERGRLGEVYNIGSGVEKSVEEIADAILTELEKPTSLKTYVQDRPGHDKRYLLNSEKIQRELGWQPSIGFERGLRETITWYAEQAKWWRPLKARVLQEHAWDKQK
jgi:dTDP-glucose 4,6-dehydratase